MASCPICERHLPDDFGLIECVQCGAALFIEFDGTVRRRDEMPSGPGPAPATSNLLLDPGQDAPAPMDASRSYNPPAGLTGVDLGKAESVVAPTPSPEAVEGEIEQQPAPPVRVSQSAGTGTVFGMKELADYGNSQLSSAREGAYSYDISIAGIDSADLRTAIKEALTDPLFLWDSEALVREAKQGELKIPKVTAVKAALIVQRLKGLPLDVKWVQHVLFEA